MSQDPSIPITPTGEENTEEVQHSQVKDEENTEEIQQPVEDEENTPEMAMHLGLPPPEALDLSGGNISANCLEEVQTEIYKLRNCDRNKFEE